MVLWNFPCSISFKQQYNQSAIALQTKTIDTSRHLDICLDGGILNCVRWWKGSHIGLCRWQIMISRSVVGVVGSGACVASGVLGTKLWPDDDR